MKNIKVGVIACASCPFCVWDDNDKTFGCWLTEGRRIISFKKYTKEKLPKFCPLRKGSAKISLFN